MRGATREDTTPRHAAALLLGAGLLLAGCSAGNGTATTTVTETERETATSPAERVTETAVSTVTPTSLAQAAAAPAPAAAGPVAPFTLEGTRLDSYAAKQRIEDIRAGAHDDVDRLVIEFSGTGRPGVIAGYDDDPRQQASGYPLVPAGNAYFGMIIQGVPLSQVWDGPEVEKANSDGVAAGSILQVKNGGIFEADAQYVVGLDAKRPYHLYFLDHPTRLVVDFQK